MNLPVRKRTERRDKNHETWPHVSMSGANPDRHIVYMKEGKKVKMNLANNRKDSNEETIGLKKCKYHCDYGDGEYCHYKEKDGCVFTKGRRLTDTESAAMAFDDPLDIPDHFIPIL